MSVRNKHWWIVQLWRILLLCLGSATLILASVSWILTGSLQSVFLIAYASFLIIGVAYAIYAIFSVNIFKGRMPKLQSRSERLFVYMSALGLYMGFVGTIFFIMSFLLLQLMKMPQAVAATIAVAELALFAVIGYVSFIRLRQNMYCDQTMGQMLRRTK